MYIDFFGMAQYPFSLTPNTRYFLKLPSHQRAFDGLVQSLELDCAFAKITGEVGTGKTMLCRKLLNSLENHKRRYITAYIPHPVMSEEGVMHALAEELSVERATGLRYYDLLKQVTETIARHCDEDKRVILFIDEAQAMPEESLEAVHLLTNVRAESGKHLQVVLFGQPELEDLLNRPVLKKLKQALSFAYELPALDRAGVEAYVEHRLYKAGYSGAQMFTAKSLDLLAVGSQGIPRLINILSHKALMVAFGKGDRIVDEMHIRDAVDDTESASAHSRRLFA